VARGADHHPNPPANGRSTFSPTRMMVILHVQPVAERGGSDQTLLNLLRTLPRAELENHVVFPAPSPLADELEATGAHLHIVPMRRLTWLRTTLFMARWRVETRAPRDPANTTQWSDSGLDPKMKGNIDARIDQCFSREMIKSIRSEWLS